MVSKWSTFVNFACSCRSVVRSLRCVLAPCPLQKQPVAAAAVFRLRAPFAKTALCKHIAIFRMLCAICYFLSAFHALQRLFFQTFVIFCKICSPPSVGSTFLKDTCKQSGLINVNFGSLLAAFSYSIPFRRALIRGYRCCSTRVLASFSFKTRFALIVGFSFLPSL